MTCENWAELFLHTQMRLFLAEFCGFRSWGRGGLQLPLRLWRQMWTLEKCMQAQTPRNVNQSVRRWLHRPRAESPGTQLPFLLSRPWFGKPSSGLTFASTQIWIKRPIVFYHVEHPEKYFSQCPQKAIVLLTTKAILFFQNMENEKKNPAVEENCSEEQKSKLLCYDEAINGALVEYAFLSQNGSVRTKTILMLWKNV